MGGRILCIAGLLWVAGCAQDPLAEHNVYWGLSPFERPSGPLVRVLDTDSDTPAKQGLLYTAMRDAEIASTYSGRPIARQDEPGEPAEALADVVYAIAPAEAPPWDAVPWDAESWHGAGYGFVAGWGSHGYGLQRALNDMADEIATASEQDPAALQAYGQHALACIENTEDRAAQVLALSEPVLSRAGGSASEATFAQIKEVAEALNRGVPGPGTSGCGLEEVERQLNEAVPARAG
jgi:hypothetical protein